MIVMIVFISGRHLNEMIEANFFAFPSRALVKKVGGRSTNQASALECSNLVIAAVPKEYYRDLPVNLLVGKLVVDVSNRNSIKRKDDE